VSRSRPSERRPPRCPNCEFSYAWDGRFCTHCHTPYPLRPAWNAATDPEWFRGPHPFASFRGLLFFGAGCVRTVLRFLPGEAAELLDLLEVTLLRDGGVAVGEARRHETDVRHFRDRVSESVPFPSPARSAVDALAFLAATAGELAPADTAYQVAALAAQAEGLAAVPVTPEERVGRPTFLDALERRADTRARFALHAGHAVPGILTAAQADELRVWRDANQQAVARRADRHRATRAAAAALCGIYRDVIAYPWEPVAFDPAWRTSTAVALAKGMSESRDFGALPILADALQDAGCEEPNVLDHCRGGGTHVRGCWVVEAVLGAP
jgi:hypothetical protein